MCACHHRLPPTAHRPPPTALHPPPFFSSPLLSHFPFDPTMIYSSISGVIDVTFLLFRSRDDSCQNFVHRYTPSLCPLLPFCTPPLLAPAPNPRSTRICHFICSFSLPSQDTFAQVDLPSFQRLHIVVFYLHSHSLAPRPRASPAVTSRSSLRVVILIAWRLCFDCG